MQATLPRQSAMIVEIPGTCGSAILASVLETGQQLALFPRRHGNGPIYPGGTGKLSITAQRRWQPGGRSFSSQASANPGGDPNPYARRPAIPGRQGSLCLRRGEREGEACENR
jgi:hypothetical protein